MFQSIILNLHSILRWLVLILALLAILRAFYGWLARRPWGQLDNRLSMFYTVSLEIQVLVGLILYFFASELTRQFMKNFSLAFQNKEIGFFAIEHVVSMILALGVAHGGRTLARKAKDAFKKHRNAAIFYSLSLVIILTALPWDRLLPPILR